MLPTFLFINFHFICLFHMFILQEAIQCFILGPPFPLRALGAFLPSHDAGASSPLLPPPIPLYSLPPGPPAASQVLVRSRGPSLEKGESLSGATPYQSRSRAMLPWCYSMRDL